eukprot:GHVP01003841.1.p1 GENE.GHVP01003841.1~~GHVP01003841.1.p1  ORF type:complete len:177 (-),score=40.66 GHVP01003841.1:710-1240(-)
MSVQVKSRTPEQKKALKELEGCKIEKVKGVKRITYSKKNQIFAMKTPEIYKFIGSNTYIILGKPEEYRIDKNLESGLSPEEIKQKNEQLKNQPTEDDIKKMTEKLESLKMSIKKDDTKLTKSSDVLHSSTMKENTEIGEDDINVVMEQANVTRNEAITALKKYNMDPVDAIMNLTI